MSQPESQPESQPVSQDLREALEHAIASPQLAGEARLIKLLTELTEAAIAARPPQLTAAMEQQINRLRSRLHEYREAFPNRRHWIYVPREGLRPRLRRPGEKHGRERGNTRLWLSVAAGVGVLALVMGAYIFWRIQVARESAQFSFGRDRQITGYSVATDESFLVFTSREAQSGEIRLYRLPLPDGDPQEIALPPGTIRFPALSNSGKQLAFWRETGAGQHRLVIRQVVGGAEAVLAQAAAAYPLAWSGDQQIASTLGSALQVWSTDGASSTVSNPGEALDGSPAFRPEHQGEILFHRHSSREGDSIWLLDGKTGKSRVLLSGLARFRGHAWSPGGGRIYFAAEYQGQRGIWMLPLGAQVPELAGVGGTFSHSPWIPPRGPDETGLPRIYWQDESERRELSRLEFPVKNWSAVELPKPPLGAPVFSPDGRLWAALVRDAPRASIWLHPRNYALALGDLEVRTSPAWSPDGRTLIFGARRTGRAQIYAQALEGGSPRLVVGCVAEVHDPLFAPDGRWIAFLCGFELYRLAWPVTPEVAPVRVALGAWRSLEVHPGTGELVAVGFDGARSAVSLPTGQLRRLPSAASVVDAAALAPWAKGFFFGSPLGSLQRAGNWGDRFAEAIPSPVPATDTDRAVSASPDGKQVFVLSRQVEHLGLHGVRLAAR